MIPLDPGYYDGSSGRPVTTGSVVNSEGNVLGSLHARRLEKLAESATGRSKAHLLAAAEAIRLLSKKNKRLGGMVGGVMKKGLLNYRGVALTGPLEDIAETIADFSSKQQVTVYRWRDMRRVRVVAGGIVPPNGHLVGTYNEAADYRRILEDLMVPERDPAPRNFRSDPPELTSLMAELSIPRKVARSILEPETK